MNQPPIPEPDNASPWSTVSATGEAAAAQFPAEKKASYVPAIICGVLLLIAFSALQYFVPGAQFLWMALCVLYVALAFFSLYEMKTLRTRLGDVVCSREQLREVAAVVDRNMKCAYIIMVVLWPLFAVALFFQVWWLLIALMVISTGLSPFLSAEEKRFKAMTFDAAQPELASGFAWLLARWAEPRFGLGALPF